MITALEGQIAIRYDIRTFSRYGQDEAVSRKSNLFNLFFHHPARCGYGKLDYLHFSAGYAVNTPDIAVSNIFENTVHHAVDRADGDINPQVGSDVHITALVDQNDGSLGAQGFSITALMIALEASISGFTK